MSALVELSTNLATRLGFGENSTTELMGVLKNTAFKSKETVSDAQMTALLIVCNQYGLNPWTKEIYAYPDKNNGIVPVVGVDGWSRIINDHPQMDGVEFRYSEQNVEHKGKKCHEWVECVLYRKDRSKPTVVREYFAEVVRSLSFATPWDTHPIRMHRHKALIQASRVAFGFSGVYDEDEAHRIVNGESGTVTSAQVESVPAELLAAAREYASKGKDAFTVDFWKTLEKSDRALISPYLDELKKTAKEADDARTVDSGAAS